MKYPFLTKWFDERSFQKRQADMMLVQKKYPSRIPIVVGPASESAPAINANKFLVPGEITAAEFLQAVRMRVPITPQTALFLFVIQIDGKEVEEKTTLLTSSTLLANVYKQNKSYDGFLYVLYDLENAFGCSC